MENGLRILLFVIEQISKVKMGHGSGLGQADGRFENHNLFQFIGEAAVRGEGFCLSNGGEGFFWLTVFLQEIGLVIEEQGILVIGSFQNPDSVFVKTGFSIIQGQLEVIVGFLTHDSMEVFHGIFV